MSDGAYDGKVEVGGDAQTRTLGCLEITKVALGPMANNCYLLRCQDTGEQLLVDAAFDDDRLLALAGDAGLATVVTTHRHDDHVQALEDVVAATGATTVAGTDDADHLPVPVDVRVGDGDTVTVGSCTLGVIHLVGHTPGSIALCYDDPDGHTHLFTGDSLFPGGVGKTWSEADFATLVDDVEHKLFDVLADDTWFYPGHGDDSTIGEQRPHLAEWRERGW